MNKSIICICRILVYLCNSKYNFLQLFFPFIVGFYNFPYPKYNDLVMQLGISKNISKRKKESALIMRKQTKLVAVLSAAALLA
ncbi:hypothetical protein, partial [[Clostridium] symbiosum]